MSTVLKEALSLSVRDRLQLIEELWDSLAATPEGIPVTDAQRRELARRRRAHARDPAAIRSWEEVRRKLERRKRSRCGSRQRQSSISMRPMPGTRSSGRVSAVSSCAPSTDPSRRSDAILRPTSSSIARCVGLCFGASRTACSSRSQRLRSSSTPSFIVPGIRALGGAGATHNPPLQRTGCAGR